MRVSRTDEARLARFQLYPARGWNNSIGFPRDRRTDTDDPDSRTYGTRSCRHGPRRLVIRRRSGVVGGGVASASRRSGLPRRFPSATAGRSYGVVGPSATSRARRRPRSARCPSPRSRGARSPATGIPRRRVGARRSAAAVDLPSKDSACGTGPRLPLFPPSFPGVYGPREIGPLIIGLFIQRRSYVETYI